MKKFYLTGQKTFGNRGCEAIVRSTVALLKRQFGCVTVFVPSDNIDLDKAQWPDHAESGVVFVPFYYPKLTRYWVQAQRLPFSCIKQMDWPFSPSSELVRTLESVDAVLSIGGDMYTYEGRLPSWIMGLDQIAIKMGIPVILWGATVSDFNKEPEFIPKLQHHFESMALKVVRESFSEKILLDEFKTSNVLRMPDSAFTLQSSKVNVEKFWPETSENGVLGLNVSPLVERFSGNSGGVSRQTAIFIREIVSTRGMSVLLIPHVTPLDGGSKNNDYEYLHSILKKVSDLGGKVQIMNPQFNSVETKYVISQCRYFIGARTHATIAAISSGLPTISIAYSAKAKGINADIFGNEPVVLSLNNLNADSLISAFDFLVNNEGRLIAILNEKIKLAREDIYQVMNELEKRLLLR